MTERIRTVRTGIVGLDVALGGGARVVRRTALLDRESAILLVRGGPGTGKSVLAQDLALRLAKALGGDALYVCVEVLPSEVIAQRVGFQGFEQAQLVDLSQPGKRPDGSAPGALLIGLPELSADDQGDPDLGEGILAVARAAGGRGYAPRVVVVDSLSEGYGLGGKTFAREIADGLCKMAVEQGWVLILIEESDEESSVSPWMFAVDTVLTLRLAPATAPEQLRRELVVTKHRFASCEPGPHRLRIQRERIAVIPPVSAYRHAVPHLLLPPPATGRSLAVPIEGTPPAAQTFSVEDGKGFLLVVDSETGIGALRVGAEVARHPGDVRLVLLEQPLGMLDQLLDGPEWMDAALDRLSQASGSIGAILVGPLQIVDGYEAREDIRRAVRLFATLLRGSGHLVIVCGAKVDEIVPRLTLIADRTWSVGEANLPHTGLVTSSKNQTFTVRFPSL